MLSVTETISIPLNEVELSQIRASGPGGQHVNKVATAVHLRFDIAASSLPEFCKQRLLSSPDHRLTNDGCIIIKAQQFRSLEKNKDDALKRLANFISTAIKEQKARKPTRPSPASRRKRLDRKNLHSRQKNLRKKVTKYD